MKNENIASLIAMSAIATVVIFAGCVGSDYTVEYSIGGGYGYPRLLVNVSGPADDLAIILTDPEENTHIAYISKEEMIDNFEGVRVSMCKGGNPPEGTYKLVVKTVTPEKVVYKTEVKFTPADVHITDAEIKLKWIGDHWLIKSGYYISDYSIYVKNDGELPLVPDKILINIDGEEIEIWGSPVRVLLLYGKSSKIEGIDQRSRYYLGPELRTDLSIIELYSEENKVASFETEIIVEY